MFIDKATLSPVSTTRKIVMQSNCNSVPEKSASPTLIPKVTMKMPFTHSAVLAHWVYTPSKTQNKNGMSLTLTY
jgi:hypothetical protein